MTVDSEVQQLAHAELIKTQMHGATNSGLEIFTEAFVGTDTLGVLGCSIAWLLVHVEFSESQSFTDSVRQTVFECCSTPQVGLRRGSIYPISLGELKGLKVALQESQLLQVQEPRFWERWQHRAWQFCALAGLNGTRGRLQPLALGPVNKMQGRAVASTGQSVCRFLHLGGSHSGEIERIRHELKGVRLSYTGEEMSVCHPLTCDQVLPALPPGDHGGSVDVLKLVSTGTKRLLEHPNLLIVDDTGQVLPPLQAKVHCSHTEMSMLSRELVNRNICSCCRLMRCSNFVDNQFSQVFSESRSLIHFRMAGKPCG